MVGTACGLRSACFTVFFLPILIAICCSYICRLEHLNRNWNMIMTSPVSVANVFLAKLIIVSILILFAQGLFMGLYWLIGTLFSLPGSFPVETIEWTIRGWYASLSISALQLGLSLRIRSFATPIGISLCGFYRLRYVYWQVWNVIPVLLAQHWHECDESG